ncbi:hypothetical protein IWX49DRAFT_521148 [Phyllosticta citricarpa]|uniref:Uncharacterized protein n=2 Tax=Phyllosticta TaxID=121621 RepID=A0ABR1LR42_9PEZI
MLRMAPSHVDILILGAGWTSTFLTPLLQQKNITYAATTTTGRDGTLLFRFDPESDDLAPYAALPRARTVLITFPLLGRGQSSHLVNMYGKAHGDGDDSSSTSSSAAPAPAAVNWIQLGSSGAFANDAHWVTAATPTDTNIARVAAEEELLAAPLRGCVLNLCGLYGGARDPRGWVSRVARSKEQVAGKKALHVVHGDDVARAIVAVHAAFTPGRRWLVTDLHVYDWWDLMFAWGPEAEAKARERLGAEEAAGLDYRRWVRELMDEQDVRALPRDAEMLGRVLDGREFWRHFGLWPERGRIV